jgi:transcriptional regulator with XRE-family HTH domain
MLFFARKMSDRIKDMIHRDFPQIDPVATGENIRRLRRKHGYEVKDLQVYFGFDKPQAIYRWQSGSALPSIDNLYALSILLREPIENILVGKESSDHNIYPDFNRASTTLKVEDSIDPSLAYCA